MGGFPMSWPDAKAWALRHWPDIDIYDERKLPYIVERHQRIIGGNMECIAASINAEPIFFVVIRSKRDPLSTPHKYRRFPEGMLALKCKKFLFSHEGDKELAEKTQYTTIADPWREWSLVSPCFCSQSTNPKSQERQFSSIESHLLRHPLTRMMARVTSSPKSRPSPETLCWTTRHIC